MTMRLPTTYADAVPVAPTHPEPLVNLTGPTIYVTRAALPGFYGYTTRDEVLRHLAFNAVVNGAEDVTVLDGWADLPGDACGMVVRRRDVEFDTPTVV